MEPRPHERGNQQQQPQPPSDPRFNGATSSRTWKRGCPDCLVTRMWDASMEPRPHERGNLEHRLEDDLGLLPASMEPRPHERGNSPWGRPTATTTTRFNGATSSRTWKRRGRRHGPRPHVRFNGATSSRTWKLPRKLIIIAEVEIVSMEPRPHERGNTRDFS